jgi:ABC-type phosphate/phosphonate transport system substrate-binding protein
MVLSKMRVAGLPMYDFPELVPDNDALWAKIAVELSATGISDIPKALTRDIGHLELWRHPGLLLVQACEYPLATEYGDSVRLIATPLYNAPGCSGAFYRSAIIVRADDDATNLAAMRGRRCAINERNSNSGMNLLRSLIAPLAEGRPFFQSVSISGSHRRSLEMIVGDQADLAAIDCVTLEHLRKFAPDIVAATRVLCWTEASPSLPLMTARAVDESIVAAIRSALRSTIEDPALDDVRNRLFLEGFDFAPDEDFTIVRGLALRAAELGYPDLV